MTGIGTLLTTTSWEAKIRVASPRDLCSSVVTSRTGWLPEDTTRFVENARYVRNDTIEWMTKSTSIIVRYRLELECIGEFRAATIAVEKLGADHCGLYRGWVEAADRTWDPCTDTLQSATNDPSSAFLSHCSRHPSPYELSAQCNPLQQGQF